jgi:hypothetical protein
VSEASRAITALKKRLSWQPISETRSQWHWDGVYIERDWNGCPYVNPLCPDDLCFLPYGHEGFDIGVHMLGTTPEPMEFGFKDLHPWGPKATPEALVQEGWRQQHIHWPDDTHGRRPAKPGPPPEDDDEEPEIDEETLQWL